MAIRQSETEGPGKNKEHVPRDTAPSRDCQRASLQHAEVRGRVFSEESGENAKRQSRERTLRLEHKHGRGGEGETD